MKCKNYEEHRFIAEDNVDSYTCVVEGCEHEEILNDNEYIGTDGAVYADTSEPCDRTNEERDVNRERE